MKVRLRHFLTVHRFIGLLMAILLLVHPPAIGQQTPEKFVRETHYLLYLPDGYDNDTNKRWPLLIFLHGSGERGDDLARVKLHGPPQLVEQGRKFPFILVSPQAPLQEGWEENSMYALLGHLKKTYRVDPSRVSLTGLSMGGYGAWALAMAHPEEFAAIAPVCGGGDSSRAWRLRHVPVWNFHGAKDDVVLPEMSERMVTAARRYNPNVRYTIFPEANHNSWDSAYGNDSLYDWILSQRRFEFTETQLDEAALEPFRGRYLSEDGDTVSLHPREGRLMGKAGKDHFQLRPAGDDVFFIEPQIPVEVNFLRKGKKVTGFVLWDNERKFFRKLR